MTHAAGSSPHRPASTVAAGGVRIGSSAPQTRLGEVRRRIADAAHRAGREPGSVMLVAVSKTVDADRVGELHAAGHTDFGESRAQELRAKCQALGPGVRWHFVGRLQRNKVKDVVGLATLIHSLDRWELVEPISERAAGQGRVQRVLVQVNQGADPAKAGIEPDEAEELVSRLRDLPGIACEGLMTVPPLGEDPRPVFRGLRRLRDQLHERFPEVRHLSMGMSGDFEAAVEEGATIVRVGTALFGARAGAMGHDSSDGS